MTDGPSEWHQTTPGGYLPDFTVCLRNSLRPYWQQGIGKSIIQGITLLIIHKPDESIPVLPYHKMMNRLVTQHKFEKVYVRKTGILPFVDQAQVRAARSKKNVHRRSLIDLKWRSYN